MIYLLCVLGGAGLATALCYAWAIKRIAEIQAKATIAESRADLLSEQQELTVRVDPFVKTIKVTGWVNKKTTFETGYQYQLFIRGVPCFEPHRIVTDTRVESEINEAGIERLKAHAAELAQLAVSATPAGRAAAIISVAAPKLLSMAR